MSFYRYFIEFSFDGTGYSGWQKQPNSVTVQEVLEEKLSFKLKHPVELTGAGRTDAGVHASCFFAHFDLGEPIKRVSIPALNMFLPRDISVKRIFRVKDDAHARFSATSRTYEYRISLLKNPFNDKYTAFIPRPLDIEAMNQAAEILRTYTDFACFSRTHAAHKTTLCKIVNNQWEHRGNTLVYTITADRFLRNMVRAITGTMLDIGTGKRSSESIHAVLQSKSRSKAGMSAPAKGLFLTEIVYPNDILTHE